MNVLTDPTYIVSSRCASIQHVSLLQILKKNSNENSAIHVITHVLLVQLVILSCEHDIAIKMEMFSDEIQVRKNRG